MISAFNSKGVKYLDGIKAANATAWHLKHNEKVDMVVALTHIGHAVAPGYTDMDLARNSEDIDLIIGGHSHTLVNPSDPESLSMVRAQCQWRQRDHSPGRIDWRLCGQGRHRSGRS